MGRKQQNASQLASVDPEPSSGDAPSAAGTAAPADKAAPAETAAEPAPAAVNHGAEGKSAALDTPSSADSAPSAPAAASEPAEPGKDDAAAEEDRPPPPPRPKPERRVSAFSSNLSELQTAFPDVADEVRRAVLVAASNNLEHAFTGMLALTDATVRPNAYIREQIEGDERLARQLATSQGQRRRRDRGDRERERERPQRSYDAQETYEGDDLYDGFQRGFSDTKQAVSSFWGSLKQRISNEVNDDEEEAFLSGRERELRESGREPARGQWWPRQTDADRAQPPLPPRKPSRASTQSSVSTPARPTVPKEPRSVNAFGDESTTQRNQWEPVKGDEPEPDAFFIGESDDDDLGSLNEEGASKDETKGEAKDTDKDVAKDAAKDDTKPLDDSEKGGVAERRPSSAKDLLSKLKLEAEKPKDKADKPGDKLETESAEKPKGDKS